jgi:hypothetical protein
VKIASRFDIPDLREHDIFCVEYLGRPRIDLGALSPVSSRSSNDQLSRFAFAIWRHSSIRDGSSGTG